jgi:hypothetical protein
MSYPLDHTGHRITTLKLAAMLRWTVRLECRACRHRRVIDSVPFWWKWHQRGWDDRLWMVPARLYCRQCWHSRSRRVIGPALALCHDKPAPIDWRYPSDGEWNRLIARYRS